MRKDVKLGLAVGGVLLAVLVVYVLVVPGNSSQPGAEVAWSDQDPTGSADTGASIAQGETGSTDSTSSSARNTTADAERSTGEPASAGGAAKGDGVADNGTSADSSTAGTAADKPAGESAGGGWNWDALVNGTEKVPSLGVATDVPANGLTRVNNNTNAPPAVRETTAPGDASGSASGQSSGLAQSTQSPPAQPQNDQAATAQNDASAQSGASAQHGGTVPMITDGTLRNADNASSAGAKTHVVKAGETYSKISQALFGTSKYYIQIEQANPNIDPTRLKPGMTITIPAIDTAKAAAPAGAQIASATIEKTLDPKTEYKVQPGDNLHNISLRLYGKADRVEKIYEANKATIGQDMARLKVGTILKLPEVPTQTVATTR